MNYVEKEKIKALIESIQFLEKSFDDLTDLLGHGGVLPGQVYSIVEMLIKELDVNGWIDWYIYDNEFGKREFEAGYDGNVKPIKCLDDLFELIDEGNTKDHTRSSDK